jgi:hypothetical protein
MSVGKNGTINTIYNVGRLKETTFPLRGSKTLSGSLAEAGKVVVDDSIAQQGDNVKCSAKETDSV